MDIQKTLQTCWEQLANIVLDLINDAMKGTTSIHKQDNKTLLVMADDVMETHTITNSGEEYDKPNGRSSVARG